LSLLDQHGRSHSYLRVSVTDRCNHRCTYCLPEDKVDWLARKDILSYEELTRLVRIFVTLGIRRVRLTGGDPTVRRDLVDFVRELGKTPELEDLAMTTNAQRLAPLAEPLAEAGLKRVNISLDALDPVRFKEITRTGDLKKVLEGVHAALDAGLTPIKINTVVQAGVNEDQILPLVDYFTPFADRVAVRFIEFMPFSGRERRHVPAQRLRLLLAQRGGLKQIAGGHGGPSDRWQLDSGLVVGFISPITEHFCAACNRLRLQADGNLRTCLSKDDAPNLRELLRAGASDSELTDAIRLQVWGKTEGHKAHLDDWTGFEGVMTQIGG